MDTKNIPISITHITNVYLFLVNKQFTTHPVQSTFVYSPVYSEKSHCSLAIFRVKARLTVVTGHFSVQ
jgi:hypothetical protein